MKKIILLTSILTAFLFFAACTVNNRIDSAGNDMQCFNKYVGDKYGVKNLTAAAECSKRLIDEKPDFPGSYYILGMNEYQNKHYKEALPYLNKAINIWSNDDNKTLSILYYMRGMANLLLKNNDGTIDDLNKAIEYDPKNVDALVGKGMAILSNNKYDVQITKFNEAIDSFDKALLIEPKNTIALNGKAMAYDLSGNYTEVIKYYKKALEIDPKDRIALYSLQKYKDQK